MITAKPNFFVFVHMQIFLYLLVITLIYERYFRRNQCGLKVVTFLSGRTKFQGKTELTTMLLVSRYTRW
jgi:hypothetical protein